MRSRGTDDIFEFSERRVYSKTRCFSNALVMSLDTSVRFLKRGVNLWLVNPRSEGYPEGKSRGKFLRF